MLKENLAIAVPTILPKIRQLLLRHDILKDKQCSILDAAVGKGALVRLLVEDFYVRADRIWGIDLCAYGHQLLKQINFIHHALNTPLPFPDGHFEICFSIETIEHLENPYGFAREIHCVLKANGTAIISTPNISQIFSRMYFLFTGHLLGFRNTDYVGSGHITPIYDPIWRKELTKAGFRIKELVYTPMRIPKLGWVPSKTRWAGQITIYLLQKVGD